MFGLSKRELYDLSDKLMQTAYEWSQHPEDIPQGVVIEPELERGRPTTLTDARKKALIKAAAEYHAPRFEFEVVQVDSATFDVRIIREKQRR